MSSRQKLKNVGEFDLLKKHIFPLIACISDGKIGDDCAVISVEKSHVRLVITTDAGSKPLVMRLGYKSYFAWGWLLILANISDLATTGCKPLTISLSVEAPNDMAVRDIEEFFSGVRAACRRFRITLSGGNMRSSSIFASHGTAIGLLDEKTNVVSRQGANNRDILISIGKNGYFISCYLKAKKYGLNRLDAAEKKQLIRPDAQIRAMQILIKADLLSSASDNSDGTIGSFMNICERSKCGVMIDFDNIKLPDYILYAAESSGLCPWNLFFFWGDWQVIATVKREKFEKFKEIVAQKKIDFTVLGEVTSKPMKIEGIIDRKPVLLEVLRNENFKLESFGSNVHNHVEYLLKSKLFKEI